jgi:hypothetical protein
MVTWRSCGQLLALEEEIIGLAGLVFLNPVLATRMR